MKREEESKLISFFQQKSFQNIFFFSLNFGSSLRRCTIGQSRNINFWRFSRRLHLTYLLKAKQYLEKFSSSWQANVFLKSANVVFFSKNGPSPVSFVFIFSLFQTNIIQFLQQINLKKCPSSIRHWDSNPQPWVSSHNHSTRAPTISKLFLLQFWMDSWQQNFCWDRVVVAQLAEWSLPILVGPMFESSYQQIFIMNIFTVYCWKDENKQKDAGNSTY